ncbi:MAG TPA: RNA methyltransferase [Noviherbaspirillum sp.]|nr:RNA methyltransferase [Noviherbaspirillum sp.]
MKSITSRDNPRYKELKQLASSASARRKTATTLLDGIHLCQSYLEHVGQPVSCVLSESALGHPEVQPVVAQCEDAGADCLVLSDALYAGLSQVEHGVGILFVARVPQPPRPARLDGDAVLLDGLQDPGNLGSILRSAAAAGIEHVYCGRGTAAAWSPKVLRAGMGAQFLLRIHEDVELEPLIANARVPVLATSSHAAQQIYDADLTRPVAWLFGNEGRGVAPHLLAQAALQIGIPQPGPIESLNVAASAAVCLFEQVRQRLRDTPTRAPDRPRPARR